MPAPMSLSAARNLMPAAAIEKINADIAADSRFELPRSHFRNLAIAAHELARYCPKSLCGALDSAKHAAIAAATIRH